MFFLSPVADGNFFSHITLSVCLACSRNSNVDSLDVETSYTVTGKSSLTIRVPNNSAVLKQFYEPVY